MWSSQRGVPYLRRKPLDDITTMIIDHKADEVIKEIHVEHYTRMCQLGCKEAELTEKYLFLLKQKTLHH
jgi:hypothetical protein